MQVYELHHKSMLIFIVYITINVYVEHENFNLSDGSKRHAPKQENKSHRIQFKSFACTSLKRQHKQQQTSNATTNHMKQSAVNRYTDVRLTLKGYLHNAIFNTKLA